MLLLSAHERKRLLAPAGHSTNRALTGQARAGQVSAALLLGALLMTACSAPPQESSPTPTQPPNSTPTPASDVLAPAVTITSPSENGVLKLDQDWNTSISFEVAGFSLTEAGACGSTPLCGEVQAFLDEQRYPLPVGEAIASPMLINLEHLGEAASGIHVLTLRLVYHDGTFNDASDSVTTRIQTPELPQQPVPAIFITDPVPTSINKIQEDENKSLPVYFQVTNITLAAPGGCTGVIGNCGHVRLHIDGAGGDLSQEMPYNAIGYLSPIDAYFAVLEAKGLSVYGERTISLVLHHDDGSPYLNSTGEVVEAASVIRAIAPDDPYVTFPADLNQSTLDFAEDGWLTIATAFELNNFTLSSDCSGQDPQRCGHINLFIDGAQGAAPSSTLYHQNASLYQIEELASFLFYWTAYNGFDPTGRHIISLQLVHEDDSPLILYAEQDVPDSGITISTSATITTEYPTGYSNPKVTILTPKNGDVLTLSEGMIQVTIKTENFALQEACGAESQCGYLCLEWDSRGSYSNACDAIGTSDTILLSTDLLENPTDPLGHWISATLISSDQTYQVNGVPVVDNAQIFLQ